MLSLGLFKLFKLNCADAVLLRKEMPEFVESDDFLCLLELFLELFFLGELV
jgi:hypothetical protein